MATVEPAAVAEAIVDVDDAGAVVVMMAVELVAAAELAAVLVGPAEVVEAVELVGAAEVVAGALVVAAATVAVAVLPAVLLEPPAALPLPQAASAAERQTAMPKSRTILIGACINSLCFRFLTVGACTSRVRLNMPPLRPSRLAHSPRNVGLRAGIFGVREELLALAGFDQRAVVQEHHLIGDTGGLG